MSNIQSSFVIFVGSSQATTKWGTHVRHRERPLEPPAHRRIDTLRLTPAGVFDAHKAVAEVAGERLRPLLHDLRLREGGNLRHLVGFKDPCKYINDDKPQGVEWVLACEWCTASFGEGASRQASMRGWAREQAARG